METQPTIEDVKRLRKEVADLKKRNRELIEKIAADMQAMKEMF